MQSPKLFKILRQTHLYFGVFIAPALLFFALSGAMQTFGLHETNRDHPNYKPAHWIQVLAQIHKKQTATIPVRRPQTPPAATPATRANSSAPPGAPAPDTQLSPRRDGLPGNLSVPPFKAARPASAAPPETHRANPLPLRIFFLAVCLGLFTSTLSGLYMAFAYRRNKALVAATLIAGIVIPALLLMF